MKNMSIGSEPRLEGHMGAVRPSAILTGESSDAASADVLARGVDFATFTPKATEGAGTSLDRLLDVTVTVTAELGRVTLPISAILNLSVNSILELDRTVAEPIDLMVQGVRLARGEVVVVGDSFAVRIKEMAEPKSGRTGK